MGFHWQDIHVEAGDVGGYRCDMDGWFRLEVIDKLFGFVILSRGGRVFLTDRLLNHTRQFELAIVMNRVEQSNEELFEGILVRQLIQQIVPGQESSCETLSYEGLQPSYKGGR